MSKNTDEIARLGRQLDKALDALALDEENPPCPISVGLKGGSGCSHKCRECWEKALNEVE